MIYTFFVRHGQSTANEQIDNGVTPNDFRTMSEPDIDLTELGVQQAKDAGLIIKTFFEQLAIAENGVLKAFGAKNQLLRKRKAIIYKSPYKRAARTAEIIADVLSERLIKHQAEEFLIREMSHGYTEGMTMDEIQAHYPDYYARRQKYSTNNFYLEYPGGESLADVGVRVGLFLQKMKEDGFKPHHIRIVTAHDYVIRTAKKILLKKDVDWFYNQPSPKNAGVLAFMWDPNNHRCQELGYLSMPKPQEPYCAQCSVSIFKQD